MKVAIGTDHAGFKLKEKLKPFIESLGAEVVDCGAYALDPNDDYVIFVQAAAKMVSDDPVNTRAIVIGGSGQGEAMAANRYKNVRCALYYGEASQQQTDVEGKQLDIVTSTREHNDANALAIGSRFLDDATVKSVVKRWLETPFTGAERHVRRIRMIDEMA